MLKERIAYQDGLPVNLLVADIDEYPIHFHEDLEVVYVLEGRVHLRNGYYNYELKQGDIFILNDREIHSFRRVGKESNTVLMLQLDLVYFSTYYKNLKNNFFVTDMEDDDDESLNVLREILIRITRGILQKGAGYEQKVIESAHHLIDCLQSDFQYFLMEDGRFVNETKKRGNKILTGRLNRITDYMYDNYYRKLTLNEIAEREHLSIYYLSHVIKEATGLSFQDLLSFIRVEESEKLLLGTKKKIGSIASETGFSAVRYYIKHFERWFGMHPEEYRREYTGRISSRESAAKLKRCEPAGIEEGLRAQMQETMADPDRKQTVKPTIVDLNLSEEEPLTEPEPLFLDQLMKKPLLEPVTEPYELIRELGENILAGGENFLVTSGDDPGQEIGSLSILVYNYDHILGQCLERVEDLAAAVQMIDQYDKNMEFLLRCEGISGRFRVYRYRLSRENMQRNLRRILQDREKRPSREILIDQWLTLPKVEQGTLTATDTLSIRTNLQGFSAEVILVQREESDPLSSH